MTMTKVSVKRISHHNLFGYRSPLTRRVDKSIFIFFCVFDNTVQYSSEYVATLKAFPVFPHAILW